MSKHMFTYPYLNIINLLNSYYLEPKFNVFLQNPMPCNEAIFCDC